MLNKRTNKQMMDSDVLRLGTIFIVTGILIILLAAALGLYIKNMSVAEYKEYCRMLLPELVYALAPERNERIIYTICVLALPLLALGSIWLVDSVKNNLDNINAQQCRWWKKLLIWTPIYVLMATAVVGCSVGTLAEFMFRPLVRCESWLPWAICLLLAGVLYLAEVFYGLNRWLPRRIMLAVFLFLPVFQTFFCRIFTLYDLHAINVHHLEIIAYSVSQAAAGRFDHDQYGLYSQILAPVFRLTGTSVFSISIIMGILYITAFWAMLKSAMEFVRGRIWVLLILMVMLLCCGMFNFLNDNRLEPYFAYHPIRFFFPAVGAWLFTLLLRKKIAVNYGLILAGAFSGLGMLWNMDGGIPLFAAFGVWLLAEFYRRRNRAAFWNGVIFGVSALVVTGAGYGIIGSAIGSEKFMEMFKSHQIFYLMGYFMLPMPLKLYPWQVVAAINIIGLIIGIRGYWQKQPGTYSQYCLFLAILGTGLFTYFQGRSHDLTLPAVIWVPLILLATYCDRILRAFRLGLISWQPTVLALPALALLTFSIATPVMRYDRIIAGTKTTWTGIINLNQSNPTEERVRFILTCAGERREVNIYGENQGIYYAETGLKAGISDFNRIYLVLIKDKIRIFQELERATIPLFVSVHPGNIPTLPPPILKNYRLTAVSPDKTIFFFEPLKTITN